MELRMILEIDIWEEIDDTLQARDDKRENYFDGKMYREMLLANLGKVPILFPTNICFRSFSVHNAEKFRKIFTAAILGSLNWIKIRIV